MCCTWIWSIRVQKSSCNEELYLFAVDVNFDRRFLSLCILGAAGEKVAHDVLINSLLISLLQITGIKSESQPGSQDKWEVRDSLHQSLTSLLINVTCEIFCKP